MRISHIPLNFCFRDKCCNRVYNQNIYGAASYQSFCNFKGLFTGIRLRDKQIIGFDTQLSGIAYVQSMLGIDKSSDAAKFLRFRDDMKCESCLAG